MQKRTLVLLFHFIGIIVSINAQSNTFDSTKYSVEKLQEDFNYWRTETQNKGTVIYLYNSKKETDHYLDSVYDCIKEPMTDIEFFRLLAPVQSIFKEVHTQITPSSAMRKSFMENQYLFPLNIEIINNKIYVEDNCSSNSKLNFNQEILSINKIPIDSIINKCALILPSEGQDNRYPLHWLNKSFFYYYYFVYGPSESYILDLKSNDGTTQIETIQGVSIKTFWSMMDRANPDVNHLNVYSQVDDSLKTVTLTMNTFSDNTIKANHKTSFRKLINEQFDIIQKTGYNNLIIDIRNHDGGNSGNGKKVLKYLLNVPFELKKSVRVVKNKHEEDLLKRTRMALNGQFQRGTYKPHRSLFNGEVYVLVNSGSTSAAVVFAATLDRHNRATFVGTEMGGNPIVMGGGIWDWLKKTPNTKITFSVANKCSILNDLELNTGHGLIPDFIVERSYEDFILDKDTIMLFVNKLIEDRVK